MRKFFMMTAATAVLAFLVGEGGYGLVDVSGEEPWASLR